MISPFIPELVRHYTVQGHPDFSPQIFKVISYGLSSYGYDIRLSNKEFKIFRRIPGQTIDPKNFDSKNLEDSALHFDKYGSYFILPAHSYALGVAVEKITMPSDVIAIAVGKSTYARCGVILGITPSEPGWSGHLTIELSNSSSADVRVYANEGIAQLLFFKGEQCETTYSDRAGKYQDQPEQVVFSKV